MRFRATLESSGKTATGIEVPVAVVEALEQRCRPASIEALVRVSTRRRVLPRAEGLLLGTAAGALWGISDVAIKYLTDTPPGPLLGLLSPWVLTALIAGAIAGAALMPAPMRATPGAD